MKNKFDFTCIIEFWIHGNVEEPEEIIPELIHIKELIDGRISVVSLSELKNDFETEGIFNPILKSLERDCGYTIMAEVTFNYGEGDGDKWWDFKYSKPRLDMPNIYPVELPLKESKYDKDGHLENMDIDDYIITTSGNLKLITDHNMSDLHFSQIKRFATLKEIIQHFEVF